MPWFANVATIQVSEDAVSTTSGPTDSQEVKSGASLVAWKRVDSIQLVRFFEWFYVVSLALAWLWFGYICFYSCVLFFVLCVFPFGFCSNITGSGLSGSRGAATKGGTEETMGGGLSGLAQKPQTFPKGDHLGINDQWLSMGNVLKGQKSGLLNFISSHFSIRNPSKSFRSCVLEFTGLSTSQAAQNEAQFQFTVYILQKSMLLIVRARQRGRRSLSDNPKSGPGLLLKRQKKRKRKRPSRNERYESMKWNSDRNKSSNIRNCAKKNKQLQKLPRGNRRKRKSRSLESAKSEPLMDTIQHVMWCDVIHIWCRIREILQYIMYRGHWDVSVVGSMSVIRGSLRWLLLSRGWWSKESSESRRETQEAGARANVWQWSKFKRIGMV